MADERHCASIASIPARRRWAWSCRVVGVILLVAAGYGVFKIGVARYLRAHYPYGHSHSCDKQLMLSLLQYAQKYGGWFPAGADSPEASLSLLSREAFGIDSEVLRGKIVPFAITDAKLKRGELLDSKSCGWYYVEGLRNDDDPKLGLFWDKVGLDHNGKLLPNGDQLVWFVRLNKELIAGADWKEFLADQARLRGEVLKQRAGAKPTE